MKYETPFPPTWKLGEFWSSADPRKKVLMVATGASEITEYGAHRDFIRWVTEGSPTKNTAAPQPVPDDVWEALQRLIENGLMAGTASAEDARTVARYRNRHCFIAAPQPVARVPLTREQIDAALAAKSGFPTSVIPIQYQIARAVEAAHGIVPLSDASAQPQGEQG